MDVEVKNLVRHFGGVKAVDGVSFAFGRGEVVGFVGPNGAGKTTTMRIMATLDEPTAGDVLLDGKSVLDYPEDAQRRIGFMPDALPEHADMTAHEYVDFFGRAFGLRGAALTAAVGKVEEFTGLVPFRDKTLKSLSKGMKQRVSLARALVHDPALLIMDEPANGLDPRARIELRELVRALAEDGKTILVSSHILTELEEMCTGTLILERGHLLRDTTRRGTAAQVPGAAAERKLRVTVRALGLPPEELARTCLELPGVTKAAPTPKGCTVELAGGEPEAAQLLARMAARVPGLVEFRPEAENLEDVFMNVTKGDLA